MASNNSNDSDVRESSPLSTTFADSYEYLVIEGRSYDDDDDYPPESFTSEQFIESAKNTGNARHKFKDSATKKTLAMLVRKENLIWDLTDKDHHNCTAVTAAWSRVSANMPDFNGSIRRRFSL